MALRIVEHAGETDVGRQRHTNEDALVVSPPFFAVADGMGGARAGEVASQIAAAAFEGEHDHGEPAEAQLARILQEANRRIYELASSDESRRGMGTTLTAAKVHGREVSLGHVGDSRAYRFRDGGLEQLTRDHSLVDELRRTGQISPEAAEHHPQRSIITRALGPEPEVEVDTYTLPGRPGDVFLLCSDGLTSMVTDDNVGAILRQEPHLERAASALVRAANQSGGNDNITVVLFRLGEDELESDGSEPAAETLVGAVRTEEVRASGAGARLAEAPPRWTPPPRVAMRRPPARRRPLRFPAQAMLRLALVLVVIGAAAGGLYAASRQVYFVGTDDAGLVTLYRGLPYDLPLGLHLYSEEHASGVPARLIPARRRARVLDHEWRSRSDAIDLVRQIERGWLDPRGTGR